MTISHLKPTASLKTRIFLAALLWSSIGLMLIGRGGVMIVGTPHEWLIPLAVMVGLFKSWLVLDRVAVRNMVRIIDKGEYSCLGGIYSWKTWALIAGMIALGKLLRASSLPLWLVGSIYVAVGCGLFWSSRKAWSRLPKLPGKESSDMN